MDPELMEAPILLLERTLGGETRRLKETLVLLAGSAEQGSIHADRQSSPKLGGISGDLEQGRVMTWLVIFSCLWALGERNCRPLVTCSVC